MSVELIRKEVELRELPKKETIQTVKERDMIVPDGKPDMQKVVYLDGAMTIDQIDVQEDRVVYKGRVDVTILYSGNESDEIYCMKGSIPLEDFIIMEGIDSNYKVEVDYAIEHIHWNILNERKLNVKAIIGVTVEATKSKPAMIVTETKMDTNAKNKVYTQSKNMDVVQLAQSGSDNMKVMDELTIMQGKDSIGELLSVTTSIKEDQIKRTDTEILYNGIIEVKSLYKGQSEEMPLQVVTHRMPFSGSVDVMKPDNEVYWDGTMEVHPTYVQVAPDYDGEDRILEVECMVDMKYNTYNKESQDVIDDMYSPGKKINMMNDETDYMTLVGRETAKVTKKDVMALDGIMPEVEDVVSIKLTPNVDDKEIQGDKLTIRGMVEAKMVYLGKEGMPPVQATMEMFPFVQEMTIPGMKKGDYVVVKVQAKDVEVSPYNKDEMLVEYVLQIIADAYQQRTMKNIDEIEVVDMSKEEINAYPSITVYIVKKGDSLWEIAKRFNTTVKDIAEINEIDAAAVIHPGQKLIVMKKNNK